VAWPELQLVWVKRRPVELMPVAGRTPLQIRLRQQKIVSLKLVACGYRLGFYSKGGGAVVV
jgi:hypothetical protein